MTTEITVTGIDGMPKWAVSMAQEYAAARGMTTISMSELFASDEYKARQARNARSYNRMVKADMAANGER